MDSKRILPFTSKKICWFRLWRHQRSMPTTIATKATDPTVAPHIVAIWRPFPVVCCGWAEEKETDVSHRRKGTTNFFCKRCISPEIEWGKPLTLQIIWWVREWVKWHRRAVISCLITTNHWISSNTAWPNSKMKAWLHEPWHVVDTVVLRSK